MATFEISDVLREEKKSLEDKLTSMEDLLHEEQDKVINQKQEIVKLENKLEEYNYDFQCLEESLSKEKAKNDKVNETNCQLMEVIEDLEFKTKAQDEDL